MVVGIYSPYRKTLGGGEQYLFTLASCLSPNHTVVFFTENQTLIQEAEGRFGLDLSRVTIAPPIFETGSFADKLQVTRGLDILFYTSDGSIPVSFAKRTFLIFQFPVPWVQGTSFITQLKLRRIHTIMVYSKFVKQFIDKEFGVSSLVFPPSIQLAEYTEQKKEKLIVSVGRFTKGKNRKRQDILIDTFKRFSDARSGHSWKLILIGGVLKEDEDLVNELQKQSQGYAIEILSNCRRSDLLSYYARASIYWHAAGFETDINEHPENVEHFGITTIEAMASGAVPIVFPAGGQAEIIQDAQNGFVWNTPDELIAKTEMIMNNSEQASMIRTNAKQSARLYDREQFCQRVHELIR